MFTVKQRSSDEPSGSKAMGLYLEAACKPKVLEQIPEKQFERGAKHHKRH
jgi:hypothetical protein